MMEPRARELKTARGKESRGWDVLIQGRPHVWGGGEGGSAGLALGTGKGC